MEEVTSDFQSKNERGPQIGRSIWTEKHESDSHKSLLSTGMLSKREQCEIKNVKCVQRCIM